MVIRLILSLSRLPHVTLLPSPVIFAWLLLAQVVILLYCAKLLREGARGLAAALAAAGLILALLPVQEGEIARLELLDVGQGQCILLRSDGETAVIDCGSAQNRAGYLLCRKLTAQRIDCVDHLILTHYDSDHINGLESLLSACPVSHLHLPRPVDEVQETAQRLTRLAGGNAVFVPDTGEVLQVGRLRLRLLQAGSGRNGGIVILVTAGAFDLLVTGDADFSGEGELMERMALPDIEVLVAGHHGSATSTGWELLQKTKPESVVISVGENSYGHPAAETLVRCERAGAEVWRTDESGGISILLFEEGTVFK
jgi:competence protein ComEC